MLLFVHGRGPPKWLGPTSHGNDTRVLFLALIESGSDTPHEKLASSCGLYYDRSRLVLY